MRNVYVIKLGKTLKMETVAPFFGKETAHL